MKRRICLVLLFILFSAGCVQKEANPLQATVALVNDEVITVEEIMALLPDPDQEKPEASQMEALQRAMLDQLVERKMLLQEVKRLKIELTQSEISERIKLLQDGLDEKTFFKYLSDQNISKKEWEKATRENHLIEKLLDQLSREDDKNAVSISDKTVRSNYENHREQWHIDEQLKLRQIIVETEEEAQSIRLLILKGADFSELARIHAKQPSTRSEEHLAYVTRLEVPAEFDPLFSSDIGSVSEVIETSFGFHIVMIEDKKPERILPFEEIKEKLYQRLLDRKREQVYSEWIQKLRIRTEVQINEALLKTIS